MTYVTDAELQEWLNLEDVVDSAKVNAANLGATARIESKTGRTFTPDTEATARFFRPLSTTWCLIDDCYEIESVATDDANDGTWSTVWSSTDWYGDPVGGVGPYGRTGWPYESIRTTGNRWFTNAARPFVKVTAKWGWAAVPDDVKLAALMLGAVLFGTHQAAAGTSLLSDDGDISQLLNPYRKLVVA